MVIMALMVVGGLFFLYLKLPTSIKEKLIGMGFVTDLIISAGVVYVVGTMTATFIGMMTGVCAGLLISILLWLRRKIGPYQELKRNGWHFYWVRKDE